jgi:hypothetical protein
VCGRSVLRRNLAIGGFPASPLPVEPLPGLLMRMLMLMLLMLLKAAANAADARAALAVAFELQTALGSLVSHWGRGSDMGPIPLCCCCCWC